MDKKKTKIHGTDIVNGCPRKHCDKPTVIECTGRFAEVDIKERKRSLCWRCPTGIITREEYSGVTKEERLEYLADEGMDEGMDEEVDVDEDITAPVVKRQHTLCQQSSGVNKPPKEEPIMKKEEDTSAVPIEQKVSCFLKIIAEEVADSPHRWVMFVPINNKMEKHHPWWRRHNDLREFAKMGLIELCIEPITTFRLTAEGIAQAGLKDIKPTALTPPIATPEKAAKKRAAATAATTPSTTIAPAEPDQPNMWERLQEKMAKKAASTETTTPRGIPDPPYVPPAKKERKRESQVVKHNLSNDLYYKLLAELEDKVVEDDDFTIGYLEYQIGGSFSSLEKKELLSFLGRATRDGRLEKVDDIHYRRLKMATSADKNNSKPKPIRRANRRKQQTAIYKLWGVGQLVKVTDICNQTSSAMFNNKGEAVQFLQKEVTDGYMSETEDGDTFQVKTLPAHVAKAIRKSSGITTPPPSPKKVEAETGKTKIEEAEKPTVITAILASFNNKSALRSPKEMRKCSHLLQEYTTEAIAEILVEMMGGKNPLLEKIDKLYRLTPEGWRIRKSDVPTSVTQEPITTPPPPEKATAKESEDVVDKTKPLSRRPTKAIHNTVMAILFEYDGQVLPAYSVLVKGQKGVSVKAVQNFTSRYRGKYFTMTPVAVKGKVGRKSSRIDFIRDPDGNLLPKKKVTVEETGITAEAAKAKANADAAVETVATEATMGYLPAVAKDNLPARLKDNTSVPPKDDFIPCDVSDVVDHRNDAIPRVSGKPDRRLPGNETNLSSTPPPPSAAPTVPITASPAPAPVLTTQASPNILTIKLDGPLSERSVRVIEAVAKVAVILDSMKPDEAAAAVYAVSNLIKS